MQLASLDLNLLVALRALLEERNVTRAGQRIGLSQPAASGALSRLRKHFGDELLVRQGNGYELTPLGESLRIRSASAYRILDELFASKAEFDPATEEREFLLFASDYVIAVFGIELARVLSLRAPNIRLRFANVDPTIVENPQVALAGVDGMLMPHGVISGLPSADVYDDEWVCMVADDHPDVGPVLTLEDLRRLPWVAYQRPYDAPVVRQIAMLGLEPQIQVSVHSFVLLPEFVAGTRRIALIQRRLAEKLRGRAPVRLLPCPFEAVPVKEALWWHPIHDHEPAHMWFREIAVRIGRGLPTLQ
ncbi:DNA-binding transcriptional LysR family regulator [Actinocorallia herbida]|uniref:DNA-binding transcriptional LysR family regulator n=1 Tax=Actinocorallia herbida TaxID=58109 RepID=A0A3N1D3E4_9ACTN|nr:LysR family transcriptional regulator [Actinocorallia herbida]ROO88045.1 DNA-binding transcriptional LysR family regulator [Actinocorallia herbida]